MANFTNIELQFNTQCTKLINNFLATNNNPDPNYINQEVNNIRVNTINQLRLQYISQLAAYTDRNVIVYYSTFLQGNITSTNPELIINDNDLNGFMNAVSYSRPIIKRFNNYCRANNINMFVSNGEINSYYTEDIDDML